MGKIISNYVIHCKSFVVYGALAKYLHSLGFVLYNKLKWRFNNNPNKILIVH